MTFHSIGSDMEVFAKDAKGNHVALCGKIGGTKYEPLQLEDAPDGFKIQEDNVAFEFNIPPATRDYQFVENMGFMRDRVAQILKPMGLSISKEASCSFDKKELTHPNALVFGCEPDYNVWTMRENDKPKADDPTLRTCGGHIHVGSTVDMVMGIRQMDLLLGVPSVILDDKPSSIQRRKLYGKAGAMRPKPYGFEYRTLSNFWMFEDYLVNWVFLQSYYACEQNYGLTDKDGKIIADCINTGNKKLAEELIKKYEISMPNPEKVAKKKEVKSNTMKIDWDEIRWDNGQGEVQVRPRPIPAAPNAED